MDTLQARPRARAGVARPTLAFAAVGALLALASSGLLWQDEYAHLLFSRWFWRHPEVAVDLWGRPLAVLAYAPGAVIGLWASRLCTVAFAALAARWTARAAEARGAPPLVAWLAVIAQPVFFRFSFGALPGTLFAALFALFLYEEARGRTKRAAVIAALLPLARVEGVLVVAVYAIALARRGSIRTAVVPFAGLAVWNLAGWIVTGEPLFMLARNPYPVVGSIYPTGGWLYLARALPAACGAAVLLLAAVGAAATARSVHHAIGAVSAAFLTLVWGVPMFASTPTPVYLIGFAPLLALFASDGWAWVRAHPGSHRALAAAAALAAVAFVPRRTLGVDALAAPVGGRERLALAAGFALVALALGARSARLVAAGLVVAALAGVVPLAAPVARDPHQRVAAEAAAWLRANRPGARLVAVAPDISWLAGADPFAGWEPGALPSARTGLAPGAVVAWDSEYSVREGRTSLDALTAAGLSEIARFGGAGVEIRLLERGR